MSKVATIELTVSLQGEVSSEMIENAMEIVCETKSAVTNLAPEIKVVWRIISEPLMNKVAV
jgi:hypothetical protein